ncbi:nuclear transport factor 2 family protein [Chitinophaga vietnamensis]|uniref:nuclear transport factor 2 family protein n=1 Tax=Chitinophaga vietnamensis TaxID=2593957 RepID=UPI0011786389|nr:nuclear transport factor 2 family protein [Chitinophaga vietnamensis]
MKNREAIIHHYVAAYNNFDVPRMMTHLDENIRFENISKGQSRLVLDGLLQFRNQAEQSRQFFSERKQTIRSFDHIDDQTTIEVDYHAVLAIDLPNGLKKGQTLQLSGKSIFTFAKDKIIALTDIS